MGECFFCGNPLAPGAGVTSIMTHPRGKRGAAMLGRQCDTCSALPWQTRMHRLTKVIQTHVCGLETDAPGLEGASHKTKPAPSRWGSSQKNCCAPPALV